MEELPYPAHPIAELYPMLPDDELRELAADVKRHGLRHPLVIIGDKILDGRNRARACQLAKVEPRFEQYDGPTDTASLLAYVRSQNLARRHLTTSQRALIAARALDLYEEAARERQLAGLKKGALPVPANLPERGAVDAREEAGADYRVSGRSVGHAKVVLDKGSPELVAAVERGDVAVSTGAELARLAKKTQLRILERAGGDAHVLRELLRDALDPPRAPAPPPPHRPTPPAASPNDPAPPTAPQRARSTQTTVTFDDDPGPDDVVYEAPEDHEPPVDEEDAGDSPAAAADRAVERRARHAEAGTLDPRRGRLPPGDGAGFDESGPVSLVAPPKPRPWREVLDLPAGPLQAGAVVDAYEELARRHADDLPIIEELRRARAVGLSAWFSRESEADLVAEVALSLCEGCTTLRVLEPSAGEGALIEGLMRAVRAAPKGRFKSLSLVAVEVDPQHIVDLESCCDPVPKGCDFTVVQGDFLHPTGELAGLLAERFDLTLTNPPYENGADGAFLARAMQISDRVVGFLRLNALTGQRRYEAVWSQVATRRHPDRPWRLRRMEIFPKRPGFDGPGDDSAKSDYVIVGLVHERVLPENEDGVATCVGWP